MKRGKEDNQTFHSMMEFEKKYFPKSFRKRIQEKPTDPHALGISLSNDTLNKIRRQMSKQTLSNTL